MVTVTLLNLAARVFSPCYLGGRNCTSCMYAGVNIPRQDFRGCGVGACVGEPYLWAPGWVGWDPTRDTHPCWIRGYPDTAALPSSYPCRISEWGASEPAWSWVGDADVPHTNGMLEYRSTSYRIRAYWL